MIDRGESTEDCPWAAVARVVESQRALFLDALAQQAPRVASDLRADAVEKGLHALWGEALNYDEYAKRAIVNPMIYPDATAAFGVPPAREIGPGRHVVHAGLQHTYLYLFSNLPTPFGFKRARWVRDDIERGFGLPEGALGPAPETGSLYRNVTVFAARLANLRVPRVRGSVDPAIRKLNHRRLKRIVIRETIRSGIGSKGRRKPPVLSTYLIEFPHSLAGRKNVAVLIYTVAPTGNLRDQKLITLFPVERGFVTQLTDPPKFGADQPIQLRYNAYAESLHQNPALRGKRDLRSQ